MTARLVALCIEANDVARVARFWAGVLNRKLAGPSGLPLLLSGDDPEFPIRVLPTTLAKAGPNQMHFDLTSTSLDDQQQTVQRALELGGRPIDVGQRPDEGHVVLADPEGNEFCVIPPGNDFLAGCGFIGALSCDGSREVGCFWSEALGWPLVWDQGEETAIQSPRGGTKITWGGPREDPKTGRNRLHLDLAASGGADLQREADRLVSLGASSVGGHAGRIAMADPDGNEFCLLAH